MGLAQAITFQEKQLDQNLYDVDYQQKEEFEWPRKQIGLYLLSLKGDRQSRGVFFRDCNRNLLDLQKKTKNNQSFLLKV